MASYYQKGFYETNNFALLDLIIKPHYNVVNVGSNYGIFCCYSAIRASKGITIGVEGNPYLFDQCIKSAFKNRLQGKIRLHQCFAGSKQDVIPICINSYFGNSAALNGKYKLPSTASEFMCTEESFGKYNLYKFEGAIYHTGKPKIYNVEVHPLDEIVQHNIKDHRVDLLIMDTDGSEYDVLEGAKKTILKNDRIIIMTEIGEGNDEKLVDFFRSNMSNHRLFVLDGNKRIKAKVLPRSWVNLLLSWLDRFRKRSKEIKEYKEILVENEKLIKCLITIFGAKEINSSKIQTFPKGTLLIVPKTPSNV